MAELEYGTVVGQYRLVSAGTERAAQGVVRFTPVEPDETTDFATVYTREAFNVTLDEDGWLRSEGGQVDELRVPAGRWEVTFRNVPGLTVKPFQFDVPAGETVILPQVQPLVPSPAVKFVVNEQVYTETLAARVAAEDARDIAVQAAEDAIAPTEEVVDARIDAKRNTANGLAPLGPDSKVPLARIPVDAIATSAEVGAVVDDALEPALTDIDDLKTKTTTGYLAPAKVAPLVSGKLPAGNVPMQAIADSSEVKAANRATVSDDIVDPSTTIGQASRVALGALPEAYIDARAHANGAISALTHGVFSASFGNSPASILNGTIVHTPSGPSNTAAYVQCKLNGPTRRIGAVVEFPVTNGGAVALVIPSGSWASGITNSGVHVTFTGGTGAVNAARYVSGALEGINLWQQGSPITGRHTLEVAVDSRRQEITVWLDGIRVLKFVDATAFNYLSEYAIWELFEFTGTSLNPAKIISAWADTERFIPSQVPLTDIQPQIGRNFGATFLPGSLTNYPLSTTVGAAAGFGTLPNVVVPPSGKFAVEFSCWVDASAGTVRLYGGIDSQAAVTVAPAGFVGRVTFHGIVSGYTPGATVTLTPKLWLGGGTGNVVVGGAFGYASISAYGLAA